MNRAIVRDAELVTKSLSLHPFGKVYWIPNPHQLDLVWKSFATHDETKVKSGNPLQVFELFGITQVQLRGLLAISLKSGPN